MCVRDYLYPAEWILNNRNATTRGGRRRLTSKEFLTFPKLIKKYSFTITLYCSSDFYKKQF